MSKPDARSDGVAGVDRMWDSQWVSVVNHDNCYRDWSKEDAIAHAVKLTEQYMASEFAKQLVALQSRLDAVLDIAADLEDSAKYPGYSYDVQETCRETAAQLRAALGGESPASDEERK